MRRLAALRTIGAIVVAGLLVGYVASEIVTTAASNGMLAGSAESPEAHNYMVAYLAGDAATAAKYRPTDTVTKALEIQNLERAAKPRRVAVGCGHGGIVRTGLADCPGAGRGTDGRDRLGQERGGAAAGGAGCGGRRRRRDRS